MKTNTLVLVISMSLTLVGYAVAQGQSAPVPAGISDLMGAMPTMLSPLDARVKNTKTTKSTGNTITISGSQITFARSSKPTLVATIASLIENSEPGREGDTLLTNAILAVLEADGGEAVTAKHVRDTIACRVRKEALRQCVATLVDAVVAAADQADDAATADKSTTNTNMT